MAKELEDLLDEIDEDAVIEILEDSNAIGGLLKALAANYDGKGWDEVDSWLRIAQSKANSIREDLVRLKYPLADNNPNQ